jgi:hypothetical protein
MPNTTVTDELLAWRLTDHVCRVCFGRVLSRTTATGIVVRCANCGTELVGEPVSHLCCCGLKTSAGKDAGLRCRRNEAPSPEQPAELAVGFMTPPPKVDRLPRPKAPDKRPGLNLE